MLKNDFSSSNFLCQVQTSVGGWMGVLIIQTFYVHTILGKGGHWSFGQCPKLCSLFFIASLTQIRFGGGGRRSVPNPPPIPKYVVSRMKIKIRQLFMNVHYKKNKKQAGVVLGQAQLKLGLNFILINYLINN